MITDDFASPHCSIQNWMGQEGLITQGCKACLQHSSGSMNLSVKGRLETNASHKFCPTKLVGQQNITTSRYRTFFFNISIYISHLRRKVTLKQKHFSPSYVFEVTTERRQMSYFYFCCKWTSLTNGHVYQRFTRNTWERKSIERKNKSVRQRDSLWLL